MTAEGSSARGAAARRAARVGRAGGLDDEPRPGAGTTGRDTADPRPKSDAARRRALDPDALHALEEERDFLLRSLDDLEREHDAGDVDDHDYEELKDDYTARAANVLRAIDERRALAASSGSGRSWVRTAGVLAVVAVLAVVVGWLAFRDSGTRTPGGTISGDFRQDSANLALQAQQQSGMAMQALQDGDQQEALDLFQQALRSYSEALELAPDNVDALTHRGWLYYRLSTAVAEGPEAEELRGLARADLDQAVALEADYGPARVFRSVAAADADDFSTAAAELDAADPSGIPSYMTSTVDRLRARIAAGQAEGGR